MSEVKVNKITPRSGTTVQVGESGDTITVPSGATLDASNATTTLPATVVTTTGTQTLTNKSIAATQLTGTVANARLTGSGAITINGAAVALGGSTTITTGIEWQSTIVTGATHTASAGQGIWIDTTSNANTLTLPSSPSVGDELVFSDFARKWATNAVTLNLNGSKFQGQTSPAPVYDTEGETVHIVYSGSTGGWIPINDGAVANEVPQAYSGVSYLVVAGGGGGGHGYTGGYYAGGGGAGGYRNSYASETSGRNSSTESTISLTPGAVYTVTVGAQGAAGASNGLSGSNGTNSSIVGTGVNIVSIGGGFGMGSNTSAGNSGGDGGSGGGAADGTQYTTATGGAGTANQGFDGGDVTVNDANSGAGGGGAAAEGTPYSGAGIPKAGGAGLASSITGSSVTRAAGGDGSDASPASKTANSGDGGDGSTNNLVTPTAGATGVVIIRIPTANYSGVTSGSPTVTTEGSDKVLVFNASGSVTG